MSIDPMTESEREREKALRELAAVKSHHAEMLQRWETQLAELKVTNASLQEALAWRESQLEALEKSRSFLEARIAQLDRTVASNNEALAWRAGQVDDLEKGLAGREAVIQTMTGELRAMHESEEWSIGVRVRSIRDRMCPEGSYRRRLYGWLTGVARAVSRR